MNSIKHCPCCLRQQEAIREQMREHEKRMKEKCPCCGKQGVEKNGYCGPMGCYEMPG